MPHDDTSEEEEEEVYPPWLQNIVDGEYYDHVHVLQYQGKRKSAHAVAAAEECMLHNCLRSICRGKAACLCCT
jgi:hypothetical protein